MKLQCVLVPVCLAALVPQAFGSFVDPSLFGWTRGAPGTTYFQWETFSSPGGPNRPDVGQYPDPLPAGWAQPDVIETSGQSFIAGDGNIYSFTSITDFIATVPSYDLGDKAATTMLLQLRTQGNDLDVNSVQVGGVRPLLTEELYRQPLGGFGGAIVDTLFLFDLPSNPATYNIRFTASDLSMSLDRLLIDTRPGPAALHGMGVEITDPPHLRGGDGTLSSGVGPLPPIPAPASFVGLLLLVTPPRRRR